MERIELDISLSKDIDAWLKERAKDITSSDVSSLFELSEYKTPFQLWMNKRHEIWDSFKTTLTFWGNQNERSIADGFSKIYGFGIDHIDCYIRCPEHRIGSSFDFLIDRKTKPAITLDDLDITKDRLTMLSMLEKHGEGLLEIKNVDFWKHSKEWQKDEATPYIELQLQHQMLVSGKKWGVIFGLVGGNTPKLIIREANERKQEQILNRCASFWKSQAEQRPPAKTEKDFEDLNKLSRAYNEDILDASENSVIEHLVEEHEKERAIRDQAITRMEGIKYNLFEEIGDAKGAKGEYWHLVASNVEDKPETVLEIKPEHVGEKIKIANGRKGYRQCRVYIKGE